MPIKKKPPKPPPPPPPPITVGQSSRPGRSQGVIKAGT